MKVDCIFNIGVAGGVDDSLNVLDVVIYTDGFVPYFGRTNGRFDNFLA